MSFLKRTLKHSELKSDRRTLESVTSTPEWVDNSLVSYKDCNSQQYLKLGGKMSYLNSLVPTVFINTGWLLIDNQILSV